MPSQTSQWSIVLSHTNRFVIGTKMEMCRMGPKDANTNPTQNYGQHTQHFQF